MSLSDELTYAPAPELAARTPAQRPAGNELAYASAHELTARNLTRLRGLASQLDLL